MKIIKLSAIDSTNDFLKDFVRQHEADNLTVVSAFEQTNGRGQMGSKWQSESGKNLTFSILLKNFIPNLDTVFELNMCVANSLVETLKKYEIPELSIKWPNDIMSGKKKIGGILIENLKHESGNISSIIGIGLNVNQTNFEGLPKASSIKNCTFKEHDLEDLLIAIVNQIASEINTPLVQRGASLKKTYLNHLFQFEKPSVFETSENAKFMGIIQNVNEKGELEILLEDDSIKSFRIKEITHHF